MIVLGVVFMLVGAGFILVASVGALRLPDLYTRIHAITKAGTVGIGFSMLSVICFHPDLSVITRALAIILFVALTAPIAAHMIGRAGYFAGEPLWHGTFVDELADHVTGQLERPESEGQDHVQGN